MATRRKPAGITDDILYPLAKGAYSAFGKKSAKKATRLYEKAEKSLAPKAMGKANKAAKKADRFARRADDFAYKGNKRKSGRR